MGRINKCIITGIVLTLLSGVNVYAQREDSYIEKLANKTGVDYLNKNNLDEAIAYFNKALDKDPNYVDALCNRGEAYVLKGNTDQAIKDFNKAMLIKPNYSRAYYDRGVAYVDKGDYTQAIADFSKAIKLKPDYAKAYHMRAAAYAVKKQYDKSWDDVYKAQALGKPVKADFLKMLKELSGRSK